MIPSNAQVARVSGDPLRIHFGNKNPRIKPVKYSAQALMDMPAHVARQAISMAEAEYMNNHYRRSVIDSLEEGWWNPEYASVRCTDVSCEVASWDFISLNNISIEFTVTTDLEGNLITTPE